MTPQKRCDFFAERIDIAQAIDDSGNMVGSKFVIHPGSWEYDIPKGWLIAEYRIVEKQEIYEGTNALPKKTLRVLINLIKNFNM